MHAIGRKKIMRQQRFRISQGEWVCAGCGAPMAEAADGEGVAMTHDAYCPEVSKLISAAG